MTLQNALFRDVNVSLGNGNDSITTNIDEAIVFRNVNINMGKGKVLVTTEALYQKKVARIAVPMPTLQHVLRVQSISQRTPVMQAPMWLAYLAMPVGPFLMGLRTAQQFVRILREKGAATEATMDLQD